LPKRGGEPLRIGSLFSGYGGLDLAVESVLPARTVWHCEWDDAPSTVLARNFPDVPNYRDVTKVDWSSVEPVDILTGGFPCQDLSLAGARRGLKEGTRSGLWSEYVKAIDTLRPSMVVIENVRGLLSANADSDLEPCPWCMGDVGGDSVLRALGAVLGDLAELGYDAEWEGVLAADAGAPHNRFRVFIVAYPRRGDAQDSVSD
jgi:DNA (cytosine-5)-methyltransferase 1